MSRDTIQEIFRALAEQLTLKISETIQTLYEDYNIQEIQGVSFTPNGTFNALLFIKHNLSTDINVSLNSYLTGLLLGYTPEDITFFYQRFDFWDYLQEQAPKDETVSYPPFSLTEWPEDLNVKFNDYLQKIWPKSKAAKRFFSNKEHAKKWLNEHEKYTTKELFQQIQKLKKSQKTE